MRRGLAVVLAVGVWASCSYALPPEQMLDVTVQKGRSTRSSGTDYDNKTQRLLFTVTVVNKHPVQAFGRLKATLIVIGRETAADRYQILDRVESEFDLPARGRHSFEGDEVILDFDDNAYAKYGVKYAAYVVLFEDPLGNRVAVRSSKSAFEKNIGAITAMKESAFFDSRFRPVGP